MPPPAPAAPRLTPLPEYRCASRLLVAFEFDLAQRDPRGVAPSWTLEWAPADAESSDRGSARELPFLPIEIDIASLGLQLGVRYFFRLAGKNLAGQGAFSRPVPLVASAVASRAAAAAAARQGGGNFARMGGSVVGGGGGTSGVGAFVHVSTWYRGEARPPRISDKFVFCRCAARAANRASCDARAAPPARSLFCARSRGSRACERLVFRALV